MAIHTYCHDELQQLSGEDLGLATLQRDPGVALVMKPYASSEVSEAETHIV